MAMAQTRRYKYNRRIHVAISWSPKSGEVACTNNLSVLINAGHRLVTQNRGRENRYEIVCGLFAHELGHCLYTDFLAGQTYNNYLSREKWCVQAAQRHCKRTSAVGVCKAGATEQ